MLDHARCEAEFGAETDRLAQLVAAVDPGLPIPTCPDWTVRELVAHVGSGHRWSAGLIESRATTASPPTPVPAPAEPAEWSDWLRAGAHQLVSAVRTAGPETSVWTWQADKTARFWLRRMLHDEVIHRFDVVMATGGSLGDLDPVVAADGVEDWLDTVKTLSGPMSFRSGMRALAGNGETLHFHATDPGLHGEWLVHRGPDGVTWERGHEKADVAVRGQVLPMLLVLNRRLAPDGLEILGDAAVFEDWLLHSQF